MCLSREERTERKPTFSVSLQEEENNCFVKSNMKKMLKSEAREIQGLLFKEK